MLELAVLGGLAVVALVAALWPLLRPPAPPPARARNEQAVYQDQLRELARDVERGVLAPAEAEAARVEIARRLLAAADLPEKPQRRRPHPALALVIGLLVATDAGWLYMRLGAPGMPDMPFTSRPAAPAEAADDSAALQTAIIALKDAAERDPGNVARWLVLARAQGASGRWADAAETYRRAIALAPDRAEAHLGLGAALTVANNNVVPEPARAAFRRTLELAPGNEMARFYLGLADAQAGDTEAATKAWLALAADLPDDDPVRAEIGRRLESSGKTLPPPAAPPPAAPAGPGPDAAAMAGAAEMTPQARTAMIQSMIARLAERLQAAPNDADGWVRLARAYRVTGDAAKAHDAIARAVALRPDDPEILLLQAHERVDGLGPETPVPADAVALFTRIEALDPAQPDALWYLGVAAWQEKKPDVARGYWQRLVPLLGPESPERRMVIDALATIAKK